MSDDKEPESQGEPEKGGTEGPRIVTSDEFKSFDFEGPIAESKTNEEHVLSDLFRQAASASLAAGNEVEHRVYSFLQMVCLIHFTPHDRAQTWGPMMQMGSRRTAIPSDFEGAQNNEMAEIIPSIKNPVLRARLADICWGNDRKLGRLATIAVNAYTECVDKLIFGDMKSEHDREGKVAFDAIDPMERALQIAFATNKKHAIPERVQAAFHLLYAKAVKEPAYVAFDKVAELGLFYDLKSAADVAKDAEALAKGAGAHYAMPVKAVWDLAAKLYDRLDDTEGKRRAQLGAVDQILLMRGQVKGAMAEAHWVMEALQALRHIKGMEEREEELERELRRLQRASTKEMTGIPLELKIGGEREQVIKLFSNFSLAESFKKFAFITGSPAVEQLRKDAEAAAKRTPLMSMMGIAHIDQDGKTIRKSEGASLKGESKESWYIREIEQSESIRRIHVVAAYIEPARQIIHAKYNIEEIHFEAIAGCSAFAPEDHKPIIILGFARLFQRDYMSAAHLLLPQLEPCLRHLLTITGTPPIRRFDDGTEEDMDLGAMLGRMRKELDRILSPDLVAEIERIFHLRPGPALRHEIAHGLLSANACFHPNAVYAMWMIYRMCVLFAMPSWDGSIAPYLCDLAGEPPEGSAGS